MFYYLHTALIHCWDSDPRNYEPFTVLFSSSSLLGKEEVDRTADGPVSLSCWCWNWDRSCHQPIFGHSSQYTWNSCVQVKVLVTESCPTLCDPMDYSLPASSLRGILQARIMEWLAIPSCRRSSQPRDQTQISCVFCIAGGFFSQWATWETLI